MKEMDPVGGGVHAGGTPRGSANGYVITFGLHSKYDMLGHYFIFMLVLPSINKFNMTSHQFNMT